MFVIFLKFADKSKASDFMEGHNDWIKTGFNDGVFLSVGTIQPPQGGMILAYNASRADIEARVNLDPFVAQGVVTPEIYEIAPSRVDERLNFLVS
jgi:uncharacterized protein YciI